MNTIILALGIIIGILLSKSKEIKIHDEISKMSSEKAQFLDPKPFKEKFKEANNIMETLDG